jgi:hypothetical protein
MLRLQNATVLRTRREGTTVSRPETELLLTEYVLGRLPDQQAQAVAQALADDAQLRTLAEFLQWLMPRLDQLARDPGGRHPTGEQLVAWTLHGDDDGDTIASHLRDCAECLRLSELVRGADHDLAAAPPSRPRRRRWVPFALAAAIGAVTFSLGLGLGRRQPPDAAGGAPLVVRLAAVTRGEAPRVAVTMTPGQSSLLLLAPHDPWTGRTTGDDFPVVARLTRAPGGETVWTLATTARVLWSRELQAMTLVVPVRDLVAGDHLLTVGGDDGVIFAGALRLTLP